MVVVRPLAGDVPHCSCWPLSAWDGPPSLRGGLLALRWRAALATRVETEVVQLRVARGPGGSGHSSEFLNVAVDSNK